MDIISTAEELGTAIKKARKELKIRQEDLSLVSDVSPRLLGEIERGKGTARVEKVLSLITNLGGTIHIEWKYKKEV